MKKVILLAMSAFILFSLTSTFSAFGAADRIRVGHFPNVTHAPALIARATNHFEKSLGENASIEWKTFTAGPEAIEALFAGELDLLYVGPNPAINGFVRSKGDALRIIAGTAAGGSAFVVREDAGIRKFEDIRGKRVASPQKGNSQDVTLLHLMRKKGLMPHSQGGDVELFNIAGGDQITVFIKKQVDAIWTVEPWVSRLTSEAGGKILFEENELWPNGKYATTLLVVRKKFMEQYPDLVQKWVEAHIKIVDWVNENYTEAKQIFNDELKQLTGKLLPTSYLDHSFGRIEFTYDPMESQVYESAERAFAIGYLGGEKIDLKNLYELSFLSRAKNRSENL